MSIRNPCNGFFSQFYNSGAALMRKASGIFNQRNVESMEETDLFIEERDEDSHLLQEEAEKINQAVVPLLRNHSEDLSLALTVSENPELQNKIIELRKFAHGILTLCTPPSNPEYIDNELEKVYHCPDHSHLLHLATDYFSMDEYQGFGIIRKKVLTPPDKKESFRCDLIYFTKHDDQVRFENRSTFSLASFTSVFTDIEERIENQKQKFLKCCDFVGEKAKEWGYDKLHFFVHPGEMRAWGFSDKDAKCVHVVAFFYKEVIPDPERIQEIFV